MNFSDRQQTGGGQGGSVMSLWTDPGRLGVAPGGETNAPDSGLSAPGEWSALGSLAGVCELHGHETTGARAGQATQAALGKKGASLSETQSMAQQAPQVKHGAADSGSAEPAQAHGPGGHDPKAPASIEARQEQDLQRGARGARRALPAHIAQCFSGVDLSHVAVYTDSPQAQQKGVRGFATIDEIHLAPGQDTDDILRHEAAHVVQFQNGKRAKTRGDKMETREENERKAETTESGGRFTPAVLGSAEPDAVRHKERDANESGAPKVVFNGTTFESIEGSFGSKSLAHAEWDKRNLFNSENWWRFPVLPIAGLYVKAGADFVPKAEVGWKGTYKYDHKEGRYQLGGEIEGELSASISLAVSGGGGINLILQRGGIGLEAEAVLKAYTKASKKFNMWIDKHGDCGIDLIPLEVELGADLKAKLNLVLWTEGWFWDEKWKWTFLEFVIGKFTGFKFELGVEMGSRGVKPKLGSVKPGSFQWGSPPNADEKNGQKTD